MKRPNSSIFRSRVAAAALVVACSLGVAGCTKKYVTFVTRTSVSVAQVESNPPEVSIGISRVEGVYGPSYDSGGVPAVFASLDTNASITQPEVEQLYATGLAAELLTGDDVGANAPELSGKKHTMFFGTNTSIGLKIGVNPANATPNLNFGYRREELSVIPIGKETPSGGGDETDVYPSVLGAIDVTTERDGSERKTGVRSATYFATGQAAVNQVRNSPALKAMAQDIAETKAASIAEQYDNAKLVSLSFIDKYDRLSPEERESVRERAMTLGLVDATYANAIRSAGTDEARVEKLFLTSILNGDATDTARIRKLTSLINFTELKLRTDQP